MGVSYTIAATNTTLRVHWSEGFKVPSFFSLSDPVVGNPELTSEESWSFDAGMTQTLWEQRLTVRATYFYHTFNDLIDFDTATFRLVNRDEVTATGVEFSLEARPVPSIDLTAHMTYVETDIKGGSAELRNRPEWRGGFSVFWRPLSTLNINVSTLCGACLGLFGSNRRAASGRLYPYGSGGHVDDHPASTGVSQGDEYIRCRL